MYTLIEQSHIFPSFGKMYCFALEYTTAVEQLPLNQTDVQLWKQDLPNAV